MLVVPLASESAEHDGLITRLWRCGLPVDGQPGRKG
jgi:hypothetical protein